MRLTIRLLSATVAALSVGGLLAAPAATAVPPDAKPLVIIDRGDFNALDVDFAAGVLTLDIKEWSGNDDLSPSTTLLRVPPAAAVTVVNGFACVGPPGSTVYLTPQVQDPNLLWLGWNTVDVPASEGPVRMELISLEGPLGGWFTLFNTGILGPTYRLNTNGGTGCPISVWPGHLSTGTFGYANWAFSALGNYTLKFRATTRGGAGASSGVVTYTFHVG